jgi:hypothetical protein
VLEVTRNEILAAEDMEKKSVRRTLDPDCPGCGGSSRDYIFVSINKNVVSPIDVINSGGSEKALVVYQVGLSSAPRDALYAFAEGLAASGWRVEITTASPEAPSDLSDYKLLVVTFPIYGDLPGEAIVRYVDRLGDLRQIKTVIINSGSQNSIMKAQVEAQNGTAIETLLAGATDLGQEGRQIAP